MSFDTAESNLLDSTDTVFRVVVNHEEQHALWPSQKAIPPGWRSTSATGSKDHCLDYVRANWTDLRPLSLRRHAGVQ